MENHNFYGNIHYKWPFSIAMLNYQRVLLLSLAFCQSSLARYEVPSSHYSQSPIDMLPSKDCTGFHSQYAGMALRFSGGEAQGGIARITVTTNHAADAKSLPCLFFCFGRLNPTCPVTPPKVHSIGGFIAQWKAPAFHQLVGSGYFFGTITLCQGNAFSMMGPCYFC